jgi:hypothetical protein
VDCSYHPKQQPGRARGFETVSGPQCRLRASCPYNPGASRESGLAKRCKLGASGAPVKSTSLTANRVVAACRGRQSVARPCSRMPMLRPGLPRALPGGARRRSTRASAARHARSGAAQPRIATRTARASPRSTRGNSTAGADDARPRRRARQAQVHPWPSGWGSPGHAGTTCGRDAPRHAGRRSIDSPRRDDRDRAAAFDFIDREAHGVRNERVGRYGLGPWGGLGNRRHGHGSAPLITTTLKMPPAARRWSCDRSRAAVTVSPLHRHSGTGENARGGSANRSQSALGCSAWPVLIGSAPRAIRVSRRVP